MKVQSKLGLSIAALAAAALATGACSMSAAGGAGNAAPAARPPVPAAGAPNDTTYVTPPPNWPAIQLYQGEVVGTQVFAQGDTSSGGQGGQAGGSVCARSNNLTHFHVHLTIVVNGNEQIGIPIGVGTLNPQISNGYVTDAYCFYELHTHDASGIIHVESGRTGVTFTLGQFFQIWGMPLSTTDVAGYTGTVILNVNGSKSNVGPRSLVLAPYQNITLQVNTTGVHPQYKFPPGY